MRLSDEPSKTEVKGLTFSIDYLLGAHIWSATLKHVALGSYTAQGFTPRQALDRAREEVHEKWDMLMHGHEQKRAHEIKS
jgi:hypothetical protein